ncbi:phosphoglycerate mutase [Egibacter rhizosphaerae]|uniref:Phosphoglycerate mutase n=1 Tax=Egibacter rhizosphaerae TaxID=1670831 RepID=A0A411YJ72_9ACTN|nr:histidine phosphatase family protein [Egibacter rhizosphaerae]QBI21132.1 phosphoglycerate mutase [Egibacter rhizosphaerae]
MTTLLLIRHGVTSATGKRLGGRTEAPLDERGVAQARAAAERLASLPIRAVYASPLRRTWETAEHIAAARRLDPRRADGLIEVEYGRWTDRPLTQVAKTKLWEAVQNRPSLVTFPEGETIRGAQERAVATVEDLVAAHRRDVVAAVSHADVIKGVIAFYLGQPLDLFQRLVIAPGSVSALQLAPGGRPALLRLNDDGPLDPAAFRAPPSRRPRAGSRSRRPSEG